MMQNIYFWKFIVLLEIFVKIKSRSAKSIHHPIIRNILISFSFISLSQLFCHQQKEHVRIKKVTQKFMYARSIYIRHYLRTAVEIQCWTFNIIGIVSKLRHVRLINRIFFLVGESMEIQSTISLLWNGEKVIEEFMEGIKERESGWEAIRTS